MSGVLENVLIPVHRDVFDYDPQQYNAEAYLEDHPGLLAMIRDIAAEHFGHELLDYRVMPPSVRFPGYPDTNDTYVFIMFTPIEETV
jgi:hypothetical protein